jgi:hypothetical protein
MKNLSNREFLELVKSGDVAAVEAAVASGEVNLRELEQNMDASPSYLIAAIRRHDRAMVECLLKLGANPEAKSYARCDGIITPYDFAARFFLDEYTKLMAPYLGTVPRDEEVEKRRWEEYFYFDNKPTFY